MISCKQVHGVTVSKACRNKFQTGNILNHLLLDKIASSHVTWERAPSQDALTLGQVNHWQLQQAAEDSAKQWFSSKDKIKRMILLTFCRRKLFVWVHYQLKEGSHGCWRNVKGRISEALWEFESWKRLRRNPLENPLIVLTRGQKSHNALRAELRFRKASWYGFDTKANSSRPEEVEIQKQLKKIYWSKQTFSA